MNFVFKDYSTLAAGNLKKIVKFWYESESVSCQGVLGIKGICIGILPDKSK